MKTYKIHVAVNYICVIEGRRESTDRFDFYGLQFADYGTIARKYMNFMLNLLF